MKDLVKLSNKILKYTALIFFIAGVFIFLRGRIANKENIPFSIVDVRFLFPEAEYLIPGKNGLYKVLTEKKQLTGFVLYGPPEKSEIKGYGGKVPFLIGMDTDYRIKMLYMLTNNETPGFSIKVYEQLKDMWTGLKPEEAYKKSVDTVTGATMTSRALIEGVSHSLSDISEIPYSLSKETSAFHFQVQFITLLFLIASFVYFFIPHTPISTNFIINILSVIIPGFLTASLLSLALFQGWINGYFTLNTHWLLFIIFLFAFGIPLFTKRNFYCNNFCPFGSAQRLIGKIYKKKWRTGRKITLLLQCIRILLIVTAFLIIITCGGIHLSLLEPFEVFRWNYASWISRIIAVFFLLLSFKIQNPWCRICPTGGIIEGVRKIREGKQNP